MQEQMQKVLNLIAQLIFLAETHSETACFQFLTLQTDIAENLHLLSATNENKKQNYKITKSRRLTRVIYMYTVSHKNWCHFAFDYNSGTS